MQDASAVQVGQGVDQRLRGACEGVHARLERTVGQRLGQGQASQVVGDEVGPARERAAAEHPTIAYPHDVGVRQLGQSRELTAQALGRGSRRQQLEHTAITSRRILRQEHLGFAAGRQRLSHTVATGEKTSSSPDRLPGCQLD